MGCRPCMMKPRGPTGLHTTNTEAGQLVTLQLSRAQSAACSLKPGAFSSPPVCHHCLLCGASSSPPIRHHAIHIYLELFALVIGLRQTSVITGWSCTLKHWPSLPPLIALVTYTCELPTAIDNDSLIFTL